MTTAPTLPGDSADAARRSRRYRLVGVAFVALWFTLGGIAHFVFIDKEMRIVPPGIPWPRLVVYVSGAFELIGAAGLLWKPTRRAAGIGLFALTLAVTPAHFYMLERPDLFSVPYWMLVARIPLQLALLALIVWSAWGIRKPPGKPVAQTDAHPPHS